MDKITRLAAGWASITDPGSSSDIYKKGLALYLASRFLLSLEREDAIEEGQASPDSEGEAESNDKIEDLEVESKSKDEESSQRIRDGGGP